MKTKKLVSVFMALVMIMTLVPSRYVNAGTMNETTEEITTEETTAEEVTTELSTVDSFGTGEVTSEVATQAATTEEITIEEITTEETTAEEVTTELSTVDNSITEEITEDVNMVAISSGPYPSVNGIIAYPYCSSLAGDGYILEPMADNSNLAKALYYSYGSLGYSQRYSDVDSAYISCGVTTDNDKFNTSKEILKNIKNGVTDDKTKEFLTVIGDLPNYNSGVFTPFYIYNINHDLVGFTSTSNSSYTTPNNTIHETTEEKEKEETTEATTEQTTEEVTEDKAEINDAGVQYLPSLLSMLMEDLPLIAEDGSEDLLGDASCSNGHVTGSSDGLHGWADESAYNYISNPGTYGFPTNLNSINSWASSYKYYDFSYASSYSHSGSFSPRGINVNINGSILAVTMSKCLTGRVDSAPSSSDDTSDMTFSQASNLRYPDSTDSYHTPPDGRTKNPQVEARIRVDPTNHRVYIRFITPYIHYDGSTAVQATNGGVWYNYTSDSYVTVNKAGILDYIDNTIINSDSNLKRFNFNGIVYGIYKPDNHATPVATFTLDANGTPTPSTVKLDANTNYEIKEIAGNDFYKADHGGGTNGFYGFNSGEHTTNDRLSAKQLNRVDEIVPYKFSFKKTCSDSACINNNLYSLAGAEYELNAFDGTPAHFIVGYEINPSYGDTSQSVKIPIFMNTGTTKFVTDENGYFTYTFNYSGASSNITNYYPNVVVNGSTYTITFSGGVICGAGSYRVQEIKASNGFTIDDACDKSMGNAHGFTLDQRNPTVSITCNEPPVLDPVKLVMEKKDLETGEVNPIGHASLEGAVFEVAYFDGYYTKAELGSKTAKAKWYFKTDSNYKWGFEESPLYSDSTYVSSPDMIDSATGQRAIPLGTFTVKEVKAPNGYLTTNDPNYKGSITVDGNEYTDTDYVMYQIKMDSTNTGAYRYLDGVTMISNPTQTMTIEAYDPLIRGELKVSKTKYEEISIGNHKNEPMPNIAFIIESKTTGEKHIVVTDENGKIDTGLNRKNVNGNDRYLDDLDNPTVVNNQLKQNSVWFFGTADENAWDYSSISKRRGSFPYDDYLIYEIASKANEGTQIIAKGQIEFSIENNDVVSLDIVDMPPPIIATKSLDDFTLTQNSFADKNCNITDTLHYKYLEANKQYTLKAVLVAREKCTLPDGTTYEPGEPILDDYGDYIMMNKPFTSSASQNGLIYDAEGTVKLEYSFDAEKLSGVKAVWQTFLSIGTDMTPLVIKDDKICLEESNVVSYTDKGELYYVTDGNLSNKDEWVDIESKYNIHTTALSEDTKEHIAGAYPTAKIIDTVQLNGLTQNRKYKLKGILMDKETGEPLDVNGSMLTVESEVFVADNETMTKDVIFEFDATSIKGKTVVVFETLYIMDVDKQGNETGKWSEIANHEDIDDEGQSVHYTDIHTTAMGKESETHKVKADKSVTIVDKVSYSNLIVGKKYTVKGILMLVPLKDNKLSTVDNEEYQKVDDVIYKLNDYPFSYDKEKQIYVDQNGYECQPLMIDGKTVTSQVTFVAEASGGEIPIEFTFNAKGLAKRDIVVFEDLYNEGDILVGTHADITDKDQTITFKPKDTSLAIKVKSIIDGHGGVQTGDVAIIGIILMMLSAFFCALLLFYKKHKRQIRAYFYYHKKKVKVKNLFLVLFLAGVITVCGKNVLASDNITYTEKGKGYEAVIEYESADSTKEYEFEKKYEGRKLTDVSYEVIDTIYPTQTETTTKNYTFDEKDDDLVDEVIKKDDVEYRVKSITWEEQPITEDVEYTVEYGYRTSEPVPEDTYSYTYVSPVTDEEKTVDLPFVRLDKGQPSWVDGFKATVTFKNIEGEEFHFGDHVVTYSDNLALNENDYAYLVQMLGYDTSLYRFNSIAWDGAAYEGAPEQLWRDATVSGQQYAAKYSAYYADTIENGTEYKANVVYEGEVIDESAEPTYLIRATAKYEKKGLSPITKGVLIGFGVILLIVVLVFLFLVLYRRNNNDNKQKVTGKKEVKINNAYVENSPYSATNDEE